MRRYFLPISALSSEPYTMVLAYPHPTARCIKSRTSELEKMGVISVAFWGPVSHEFVLQDTSSNMFDSSSLRMKRLVRLGVLDVLGKGYSGVAVFARYKKKTVVLKIRRTDSKRSNLRAKMLVSFCGKLPRRIIAYRNFVVMEYLQGLTIGKWARMVPF